MEFSNKAITEIAEELTNKAIDELIKGSGTNMKNTVLKFQAKHMDICFFLQDGKGLEQALEKIFKFNIDQNMYCDEDMEEAKHILSLKDDPKYLNWVKKFMEGRRNCEYEDWDLDHIYTPDQEIR